MSGSGWGPKMTLINSRVTWKSSLHRIALFLPKDGEGTERFPAPPPPFVCPPHCSWRVLFFFFTVYDARNVAARREAAGQGGVGRAERVYFSFFLFEG